MILELQKIGILGSMCSTSMAARAFARPWHTRGLLLFYFWAGYLFFWVCYITVSARLLTGTVCYLGLRRICFFLYYIRAPWLG